MSSVEFVVVEEPEPRGLPAFVAEIVGTFLLVFAICGFVSVFTGSSDGGMDIVGLALVHALALMVIVYAIGGASGAHVNPAVTIALWWLKKISGRNAVIYIVCQCIGAILAALLVVLLFNDAGDPVNYGTPAINPDVIQGGSVWLALIAEAIGTFVLFWAIMGVAVNPRGEAALAGVAIGGALGAAELIFGLATGGSFNPARWLGPALVSGEFSDFWLYVVGPIVGAVAAAVIYTAFVLIERGLPPQRPQDELAG
jgi:MIP family channel proteins